MPVRHSRAMRVYRTLLLVAALLAVASVAAQPQSPPPAQTGVMTQEPPTAQQGALTVTTDTTAYCDDLADRIAAEQRAHPAAAVPEVRALAEEGQHMCDSGLIRGGLTRLRRALLMLESQK